MSATVEHVVLIGLMGSGKTVVGRPLAEISGRSFVDNDELLEAVSGLSAADYADRYGLEDLHELELQVLSRALGRRSPSVVAAAASVVDSEAVDPLLEPHVVVWLTADVATLAERTHGPDHRPLAEGRRAIESLQSQLTARGPRYAALADLEVDTVGLTPDEIATRLSSRLPKDAGLP